MFIIFFTYLSKLYQVLRREITVHKYVQILNRTQMMYWLCLLLGKHDVDCF